MSDDPEGCPAIDVSMQLLLEVRRIVAENDRLLREVLAMMHQQAKNLEHLPKLNDIATTLHDIKEQLIEPATGRKQIPMLSHLITVAVLGAIILVVFLKDSGKSFSLGPNGIQIGQGQDESKQSN